MFIIWGGRFSNKGINIRIFGLQLMHSPALEK